MVFLANNVGNVHVVSRRAEIFQFLAREDINGDKMDFGVTMFASLGSTHFHDLARATLDHNEAVLAERGTLHRIGGRSASIGALESVFML